MHRDDHDASQQGPRGRRRRVPRACGAVGRERRSGHRQGCGHRAVDRSALARDQVHARAVPDGRHRPVDPHARQGIRRAHQGAVPVVPEGAREARRQDRRHSQAQGVYMTTTALAPEELLLEQRKPEGITKVSIIVSKGTLEGIYPGLIMANGARMEGIDANLFFTFFGMDAITKRKMDKVKVAAVGNPALGLPALLGIIPGMSAFVTHQMAKKMEALDIPPIPEFIRLIADSGAKLYACKASVDMFGLKEEDFVDALEGILTVGEFYEKAAGGWRADHLHVITATRISPEVLSRAAAVIRCLG